MQGMRKMRKLCRAETAEADRGLSRKRSARNAEEVWSDGMEDSESFMDAVIFQDADLPKT